MESQIEPYEKYYARQAGGGIYSWYRGAPYQRGHGIGSFLGGLFRAALPLIKKGALAVGKEALGAGVNVLDDVANDIPFRQSVGSQLDNVQNNLKRKAKDKVMGFLRGEGYKPKKRPRLAQLKSKSRGRKSNKPKSKLNKVKKIKKSKKNTRRTLKGRIRRKSAQKRSKYDLNQDIFN